MNYELHRAIAPERVLGENCGVGLIACWMLAATMAIGLLWGELPACPSEPMKRCLCKELGVNHIEELARMLATDELTTTKLVDGTGVILDVDSLQVFTLNETGMFLVEALGEGVADREGLVARLVESFEVEDEVAGEDVDAFIGDLGTFLVEKRKK